MNFLAKIVIIYLILFFMLNPNPSNAHDNPTIVVVGAGLAGLTAAYRLHQKGMNIEVYEARNRVGGRVHSVLLKNKNGNYSIGELGGQNITDGGEGGYMLALAKEFNLKVEDKYVSFNRIFYDKGKTYNPYLLLKEQKFDPETITAQLNKLGNSSISMKEVLDQIFPGESILKRIFSFQLSAYEGSRVELLSTYHNIDTLKYGLLGGLSSSHQVQGDKPQFHWAALTAGNASLPMKIAEVMSDKIYLNKVLMKVELIKNNKIQLSFKDGSQTIADKLILAIPCSVYQDIEFDDKIIPAKRLEKINNVQYGTNAKILVAIKNQKADASIFTDNVGVFYNTDTKLLNIYFAGNTEKEILDNLEKGFNTAVEVIQNNFTILELRDHQLAIAKDEQFTRYNTPVAKSWSTDIYSKGSYSNYGLKLGEELGKHNVYKNIVVKTIFEPINDKVFFIGEHASIIDEIGTMEAAVESGERIAKLFSY